MMIERLGGYRIYTSIKELGFNSFSEVPDLASIFKKMEMRSFFITYTNLEGTIYNSNVLPINTGLDAYGMLKLTRYDYRSLAEYISSRNKRFTTACENMYTGVYTVYPWKQLAYVE